MMDDDSCRNGREWSSRVEKIAQGLAAAGLITVGGAKFLHFCTFHPPPLTRFAAAAIPK